MADKFFVIPILEAQRGYSPPCGDPRERQAFDYSGTVSLRRQQGRFAWVFELDAHLYGLVTERLRSVAVPADTPGELRSPMLPNAIVLVHEGHMREFLDFCKEAGVVCVRADVSTANRERLQPRWDTPRAAA